MTGVRTYVGIRLEIYIRKIGGCNKIITEYSIKMKKI